MQSSDLLKKPTVNLADKYCLLSLTITAQGYVHASMPFKFLIQSNKIKKYKHKIKQANK